METDVCLILEGSYPHVRGGVSAWVDQLVRGLPDVRFSLVHLRDEDDPVRRSVYERPANLVDLRVINADPERDELGAELVRQFPDAQVYHGLSTGLAGLAGAEAAEARGRPFVLTEHGLAWREARFGIEGCKPHIAGCKPHIAGCKPHRLPPGMEKEDWGRLVEEAARSAYARAHTITTVCRENARLQASQGADLNRLRVIANAPPPMCSSAQDESSFTGAQAGALRAPRIGFVGRVVAIKDVETYLRACRLVADELPEAEFAVVGPLDHEPEYAEACIELARGLRLGDRVRFTGEVDAHQWYRRLDVVALTSLSEAQPLVLLEAMAAGVAVVSTAVGGCPELLEGAGLLTPVRDPRATARAILRLCSDSELRARLVRSGRARVLRRHSRPAMLAAYRRLYERSLERRAA